LRASGASRLSTKGNFTAVRSMDESGRSDHELMTIGPTWLTSYHGDCPMRMRYRVLAQDVVKYQEQAMLEITLKESPITGFFLGSS
jgi:hypothetical protein